MSTFMLRFYLHYYRTIKEPVEIFLCKDGLLIYVMINLQYELITGLLMVQKANVKT